MVRFLIENEVKSQSSYFLNTVLSLFSPFLFGAFRMRFSSDFYVSVFNVIDQDGNKIRDKELLSYIQRVSL